MTPPKRPALKRSMAQHVRTLGVSLALARSEVHQLLEAYRALRRESMATQGCWGSVAGARGELLDVALRPPHPDPAFPLGQVDVRRLVTEAQKEVPPSEHAERRIQAVVGVERGLPHRHSVE